MAEQRGPRGSGRKPRKPRPDVIDLAATPVGDGEPVVDSTTDIPAAEQPPAEAAVEAPVPGAEEIYGPHLEGQEPLPAAEGDAPADAFGETVVTDKAEAAEAAAAERARAEEAAATPVLASNGGAEPRSNFGALLAAGVAGAALTLTGLVLLAMAELLPLPAGSDPALANRLTALEAEIAQRPAGGDAAPAAAAPDPRVEDILGQVEAERQRIAANSSAIEELRAQLAAAPDASPATVDPEAEARIGDIDRRLAELGQSLDVLKTEVQDNTAGEQIQALDGRIASTEQRLEAIGRVEAEMKTLGESVSATRAGAEAESRRASEAAAIALLDSTATRGVPFKSALDRVKTLVPDQSVAALEAQSQSGLVPLDAAAARLSRDLAAAPMPGPSTDASLVDRFLIGARELVSIRQVDGPAAGVPAGTARARVGTLLQNGDHAAALDEWEKLDEPARNATKQSAEALRQRVEAETELQNLRQRALAASGETNEGAEP